MLLVAISCCAFYRWYPLPESFFLVLTVMYIYIELVICLKFGDII